MIGAFIVAFIYIAIGILSFVAVTYVAWQGLKCIGSKVFRNEIDCVFSSESTT